MHHMHTKRSDSTNALSGADCAASADGKNSFLANDLGLALLAHILVIH